MYTITPKCIAVANYIIEAINQYNKHKEELRQQVLLSTKKMQRLLYLCEVEYMKRNNGTPLFKDDFYAWPSGPTIPRGYTLFIQSMDCKMHPIESSNPVELTDDIKIIIDEILDKTKELDTTELMDITNIVDGPWHQVYQEDDKEHKQIVSKLETYRFYKNRNLFEPIPKIQDEEYRETPFTIKRQNNAIIIQKNNQSFAIDQSPDDDIWFSTSQDDISISLSLASRNYEEWQTYLTFENLVKSIIGRYILTKDNIDSFLPNDFIDLENKVITWHSDSDIDNILKIKYINYRTIIISISKNKNSKDYQNNSVRIRTSDSEYQYYYQEFLEFVRQLLILEQRLNKKEPRVKSLLEVQENKFRSRKLFLFKKRNNGNIDKK